jgi:uncharacterized protein YciW
MKINLKELEKDKKRNSEERLQFIRNYADWVRKNCVK